MVQRFKDFSTLSVNGDITLFLEQRIENDASGNPLYVGYSKRAGSPTDDESWYIIKYSYSDGYVTRAQLPDNGVGFSYAWDSRSTYFT